METIIETPRLRIVAVVDTGLDSQHLQWFHQLWTNDDFTAWSLHGKTNTLLESQTWMKEQQTKLHAINYGIFEKADVSGELHEEPGLLVGSVNLRTQDGPTLPPFPPPSPASNPLSTDDVTQPNKLLNLRTLGYGLFRTAWGKGYATEASRAFIDAYIASIADKKKEGKEIFYLEGTFDKDHSASQKVLMKLGFKEVGWKVVEERVFLAGKWRDPGYWIYGMYV